MAVPPHVRALLKAPAWPFGGSAAHLVQTHISYVLIGESDVLKLKKPVKLPFVDFSTLVQRREACEAEVRLNRRGCASAYYGVVSITQHNGDVSVGGNGEVIDWAVHMRRLSQEEALDHLLAEGRVSIATLGRVVSRLVAYYGNAERSERISTLGGFETFADNWRSLLHNLQPFAGHTVTRRQLQRLHAFANAQLLKLEPLLQRRASKGYIRDCHGDLRSDAIYLDEAEASEVCLVDCIEFNERYRYQDVALDIAFLAMDIEFRSRPDLSDVFVGLYAAAAGDKELPLLLPAFKCYRAMIRALVESTLATSPEVSSSERAEARRRARDYMRLALSYTQLSNKPGLVMVSGPTGSGKSVLAGALAARLNAALLSTDVTRRELGANVGAGVGIDEGSYRPEQRMAVYEALARQAEAHLGQGRAVVMDGTLGERAQRQLVLDVARNLAAKVLLVECEAPEAVIRERQQQRGGEAWNASDGTWEVYLAQRRRWEPPTELPGREKVVVDTTVPLGRQIELVTARWLKPRT